MKIGEIIPADREIILNEGKKTTKILVANKGDRPVQVGSHFHFFEVNKCLSFDREAAYGYHLDIPSGTSVRFEPGSGNNSSCYCLEILFQQMDLLIKRYCQAYGCRCQKITDVFSTFVIIIVINVEYQKNTNDTDD